METSASPAEIRSARLDRTWMIGVRTRADAAVAPAPRNTSSPATKRVSVSAERLTVAEIGELHRQVPRFTTPPPSLRAYPACREEQYHPGKRGDIVRLGGRGNDGPITSLPAARTP